MTFETMKNPLRPKLASGATTFGIWITLRDPGVTELVATLGIDWVVIDLEHGSLSHRDLVAHARAAKGTGVAVLTRVPSLAIDHLKRALDLGVDGVIVPYVKSAAEVEEAFRICRYPPRGERGIGGERAVHWGLRMQDYLQAADSETLVIPLIETRAASADFEAIAAVQGLETIFFGPADFSASWGHTGQWEGPGVAEDILRIKAIAARRGITSGVIGLNPGDQKRRIDQGFGMVGLGADMVFIAQGVKALMHLHRGQTYDHRGF